MPRIAFATFILVTTAHYVNCKHCDAARITTIAFEGQTVPGGDGAFMVFGRPALSDDGTVAWVSRLTGTSGTFNDTGILHYSCGQLSFADRESGSSPDASGASDHNGVFEDLRYVRFQLGIGGDLAGRHVTPGRQWPVHP